MSKARLTLGQRLSITLVLILLALQGIAIALDRYEFVTERMRRSHLRGPFDVAQQALIVARFPEAERAGAARTFSDPRDQVFHRPVPGLHPADVRDEELEERALIALRESGVAAAELRIASRVFGSLHLIAPDQRAVQTERPALLSLGEPTRPRFLTRPRYVPAWVSGDWADLAPEENIARTADPMTGPPRPAEDVAVLEAPPPRERRVHSAKVSTYALRLEGDDAWTTLYRLERPPPWNVQYSKLVFSLLAAVVVGILAILVGRVNIRPLRDLARGAERLSRGERAPDVPVRGARDVQEIVAAFNAMNARVSQAADYQVGLLRSIGHDLKGPLAAVARLVSTIGPNETRAQIERRLESVQGIVEAILSFSRAVMRDGEIERADLSEIVHAVVDEQADLGADAKAETPGRLLVDCRINATERCLRNLVENGLKYGGSVRARAFADGAEAVVWIDDAGPGVPEDRLESVFQPFTRLADDGEGTGLGLAIARTIAVDQGGTVTLTNRPEGGLRAELRLLLAGSEA